MVGLHDGGASPLREGARRHRHRVVGFRDAGETTMLQHDGSVGRADGKPLPVFGCSTKHVLKYLADGTLRPRTG